MRGGADRLDGGADAAVPTGTAAGRGWRRCQCARLLSAVALWQPDRPSAIPLVWHRLHAGVELRRPSAHDPWRGLATRLDDRRGGAAVGPAQPATLVRRVLAVRVRCRG